MINFSDNKKSIVITRNATYAAAYVALCFIFAPISYGPIQIRIAESLTILPIFDKYALISITLGCFLSNLFMSNIWDMIFGTIATFIGLFFINRIKTNNFFVKMLPSILSNAIIIPLVLKYGYGYSDVVYYMEFFFISIGEIISIYGIGYILYKCLWKMIK